jgi:formylglycine-generating enzyme required for sulfatase activity
MNRLQIIILILCLNIVVSLQAEDQKALLVEKKSGSRWALLVGVTKYNNFSDLKYCSRDMDALKKQLVQSGFPENHVDLMHNAADEPRMHPNKNNIERRLKIVLGKAQKGDLIVIAFSGHGVHLNGKSYLASTDADLDQPSHTMVLLESVYELMNESEAHFKLILVDACRNIPLQEGCKALSDRKSCEKNSKAFTKEFAEPPKGIIALTSCAPGQFSYEDKRFQHGVFMKFYIEGLQGKADFNKDGVISLLESYQHSSRKTSNYIDKRFNDLQTPRLRGQLDGDFPISTARIAPSDIKPKPEMQTLPKPSIIVAPFNKKEAEAKQTAWARHLKVDVTKTNSIGMKLKLIPAGEFLMGSGQSAEEMAKIGNKKTSFFEDEHPQHSVKITKPFYMGMHEVTQQDYERIMERIPSHFQATGGGKELVSGKDTSRFPVEMVTWYDAVSFCNKLSERENLPFYYSISNIKKDNDVSIESANVRFQGGKGYHLPTEAEWEYACRAGTTTPFNFGTSGNGTKSNVDGRYPYGTETKGPYLGRTTSVGSYDPNSFGLYDMHGNVYEWCSDRYDSDYYETLAGKVTENPQGPSLGKDRVLRGGSWIGNHYVRGSRSAHRNSHSPSYRSIKYFRNNGFRVVVELE